MEREEKRIASELKKIRIELEQMNRHKQLDLTKRLNPDIDISTFANIINDYVDKYHETKRMFE